MGHQSRRDSPATSSTSAMSRSELDTVELPIDWPYGRVEVANRDDLRETAYEVFFIACRSSPGFCGRNTLSTYSSQDCGDGSPTASGGGSPRNGLGLVASSRTKRALGLKMSIKRLSPNRGSINPNSVNAPGSPRVRPKRPMTMAELMRQQMRVSEQSESRLRKTIMRTLVGQMGRRANTIILPLELLRHLKPSEFNDTNEYQIWQKRQLRILEAGILVHPSVPLDLSEPSAMRLMEIIRLSETKPIDTGKGSETMKTLTNCVVSLAWRGPNGAASDSCHWADGFPINIHLYMLLLQSIFDLKNQTVVIDEVDEVIDLIKKTWPTLGINKLVHNVCFTWLLFQQFVATGQVEHDLLSASLMMLAEVANDAKRSDREFMYVKILSSTLVTMLGWADDQLQNYHESLEKSTAGTVETILPLALSAAKILKEDASIVPGVFFQEEEQEVDSAENRVDRYIRSSMKNAFNKMFENGIFNSSTDEDASEALIQLAKDTEELAKTEKETFSCILRRWYPVATAIAIVTLNNCYRFVLKQYLAGIVSLTEEVILVLDAAGKLEKVLVNMVFEDTADQEDGGKTIIQEMVPYEVENVVLRFMKIWVYERLKRLRECLDRAKDTETWNPKSMKEPYARSATELMKLAAETVDDFFSIPVKELNDDLIQNLADGLENIFQGYITFLASCGSKQTYVPPLPPLTRCNRRSKFSLLWKNSILCRAGFANSHKINSRGGDDPRPSMSRGTQRLFIRVNTLYFILSQIHSLEKAFSSAPTSATKPHFPNSCRRLTSFFDPTRSAIQSAIQQVSEVNAFRLIFLDSNAIFYDTLYVGDVAGARINPTLQDLKQNLALLTAIASERAQPLVVKEAMKACFEAFLMVLLAGGSSRVFTHSDYDMVAEDFRSLKRIFSAVTGEGLVPEAVVDKEAEIVDGVIRLMGQASEQLIEDFSIIACEASGMRLKGDPGSKVPMPPTTGLWNQADPNTILRVLCHRNDSTANNFLKNAFQLPRRR